ncbi:MAG: sulfatase-like hydrolase/transferase, partial [Deltaproteobacteria bacterium]|nr:sulfatase-like hydrolase/transferase [Deltaproteobacteria bacterium]
MLRTVASAVVAGAVAAVLAAAIESLLGSGAPYLQSLLAAVGLLLPVGLLVGIGWIALRELLPRGTRPVDWARRLRSKDAPDTAGAILAAGLVALATLAVGFRLILFFLTSFNHPGLAALALAVSVALLAIAVVISTRRLVPLAARLIQRAPASAAFLRRPLIALMFTSGCWCAALIPPLVVGPDATGAFGFVGLLMKDGLGAGPLISLLGIAALAAVVLVVLLRTGGSRWLTALGALVLIGTLLGPLWAHGQASNNPEVLDRLDASNGLSPLVGKLARRLGDADEDGHSRWMGGKDCNDDDPTVNPGARDVPDNGVDEDCSGEDLELAALEAAAPVAEPPIEAPAGEPRRPDLPEDVSLLLITVDSLRWNVTGFMGYERDTTPNLDALVARGGTVYERAYALGSYTGQAVPPMLTGKYASELHRTDRHEVRIYNDETFAAELVCNKEVRCAGVLSHFLFRKLFGWNQGFHE